METLGSRDCLRHIDQFITDAEGVDSYYEMLAVLGRYLQKLGFSYLTYELLVPPTPLGRPMFITTYPSSWIARYQEQGYESLDLTLAYAAKAVRPFLWQDVGPLQAMAPRHREVFTDAGEFGFRTGGAIPLHGPGRAEAHLSIISEMFPASFAKLFARHQHELLLLATYTHERMLRLGCGTAGSAAGPKLTVRETEVLTWVARGKTRQDVSDILGLSAHTIKDHLERACAKLGAANKTHATVIALMNGLIRP